MSGKIHLVIPDIHSHPDHHNDRADLLSRLVIDLRPDVVVNMGDHFDMPSLCAYDKGKRSYEGRSYFADIASGMEFHDRMWEPVKRRKKAMPYRVVLEGNHEHRVERALDLSPELVDTISFKDYGFQDYYDLVVRYSGHTPGVVQLDGITYAHYAISGVMGRPVGGEHAAYSLLAKKFCTTTVSHSHLIDFSTRTTIDGRKINGLVSGCFIDYVADWAGEQQKLWWSGVVICRNVEDGNYDPEFVSMNRLEKEYG